MKSWCIGLAVVVGLLSGTPVAAADDPLAWPSITKECRPWAYHWWLGSAADEKNLTRELARYRDGGLGGVHIIPIYGAKGFEERYVDYLSPRWMELLAYTVREAARLGLGVDMTTGTGWCFGGPNVPKEHACIPVERKTYTVAAGATLEIKPRGGVVLAASAQRADGGESRNLLAGHTTTDKFTFRAPVGPAWQVAVVTQRGNGPAVKRAGPGGAGPMLNPLYGAAMENYLTRFTSVFPAAGGSVRPRAMYHDSYEYRSEWTPDLLGQFAERRGYRLEQHLGDFCRETPNEAATRVLADYRETLADMLLENSIPRWIDWCRARGIVTRYQAHGSPGNLLDLYALADVPETEMFGRGKRDPLVSRFEAHFGEEGDREVLVSKFASSAAHVAGRNRVAAETCTWMAEHFCETLEEIKCFVDLMFVSGVNHVFYHGCCYSPDEAPWPGWLFYASTEMNPRNSIWRDVPTLNAYIARCQSVLQTGRPDNDLLVYWPIHDAWHTPQKALVPGFTVHNRGEHWLGSQPIGKLARQLWTRGFAFDYVSDRQLIAAQAGNPGIEVPGGKYRALVVPPVEHMPLPTFEKMLLLAAGGATVIFEKLPTDVPGLVDLDKRRQVLRTLLADVKLSKSSAPNLQEAQFVRGRILVGDVEAALQRAAIARETLVDQPGMLFVRRSHDEGRHYFLANQGEQAVDGWIALATPAVAVAVLDPLSGRAGVGAVRQQAGQTQVRLQLPPGAALMLRTFTRRNLAGPAWEIPRPAGAPVTLAGSWQVKFVQGGPELPKSYQADKLDSWTRSGDPRAECFAGSAAYTLRFDAPAGKRFLLDLGRVCHSARVRLNGRELGTLIMAPYRLVVEELKPTDNLLEVEVTNLSANRIRDLDRRKVVWRTFQEINLVNIGYKPFDASNWPLFDSGLLGPVTLAPAK